VIPKKVQTKFDFPEGKDDENQVDYPKDN